MDSGRPHRSRAHADEWKDRERKEATRQVLEQVIAVPEQHAGLEDRVVEAGRAHDLLGRPLGFVVRAAAARPRAEEAHVHQFSHTGAARRRDHRRGPGDVDARVGLSADLPVDAGAMRDGRAA